MSIEFEALTIQRWPPPANSAIANSLGPSVEEVFATAYTGFRAARAESGAGFEVVVHTGHWGTGAYGGDRVLMALL